MIEQETLANVWFIILWAVFASYLVLDGFDFGVGISYLFGTETEKSRMRAAIGPFWDGNETWLVLFAGILFAAFPLSYGNLLSHFYVSTFLILFLLIFRGASLEFRSLVTKPYLRKFWDIAFFVSSFLVPMLFGIVASNNYQDITLNQNLSDATIRVKTTLNFEAIATGLFLVSILAVHGSNFIQLRLDGELQDKCCKLSLKYCLGSTAFLMCVLLFQGNAIQLASDIEWSALHVGLLLIFVFLIGMFISIWNHCRLCSFVLSTGTIILTVVVFALSIYPNLTVSATSSTDTITIVDSMSSHATLTRMLLFAAFGMPFAIAYTIMSYRIFWRT